MTLKLGLFVPHAPANVFETFAVKADSSGFDFICCDDHLMSPFSPMTPDFQGCYEAWTAMAYLAGKTRRVKLSHMVLVPAFRTPGVLAKMAATLDLLSGGRLILTVGAGWYQKEFQAYSVPWEKHSLRIRREREAIEIIRSLWTEGELTFEGEYYTLRGATVIPKPLQSPSPPIWIGGDSRQSMELAVELGDGWLMHGHSPEEVRRMVLKAKPMIRRRGEVFSFCTAHFVLMGADQEKAEAKLRQIIPEKTWKDFMKAGIRKEIKHRISGTPRECLSRLREYADAGVTHLICIFLDPLDLDLFAKEVLPEFQRT
jgi:FMNH2-dependent dimethyl sulfone monooxygenase